MNSNNLSQMTMVEHIKCELDDDFADKDGKLCDYDQQSTFEKLPVRKVGQMKISECFKSTKRKPNRFDGLSEEELYRRSLPDHLAPNLDILIIGINPGLFAAYKGHHYAGPGNHFWKCLFMSGLIPQPMTANDDFKLIDYGIGFTNIVQRTTRTSADLKQQEIKDGAKILLEKIRMYKPKIAVFNGKEIYRIFSGKKEFSFGKQPEFVDDTQTLIYVMPSSSARCSQLPRAADKVPFYVALRKLRDHVRGELPCLTEQEVSFSSMLVTAPRKSGPLQMKNELLQDDDDRNDGIYSLDAQGRPRLRVDKLFDSNLVKSEDPDEQQDEELMEQSLAEQFAPQMTLDAIDSGLLTPTDLSEFFIDPVKIGTLFCSPTTSSATQDGEDGQQTDGQTGDTHQQQSNESNGAASVQNSDSEQEQSQSLAQEHNTGANYDQAVNVVGVGLGVGDAASMSHPLFDQANGDNVLLLSGQQLEGELVQQAVPAPASHAGSRPSNSSLPPEVAMHVEEAIENVVQRARAGPLEMPAFRTPAEKTAAAHAQQQQQQQQQMLANLQLQAAAVAAAQAAHFDLSGRIKSEQILGYGNDQSGGSTPASLYQYFQQPPQSNPSGFQGAGANAFTSSANNAAVANYAWQTAGFSAAATTTANQNTNLYNQAMTAQYFQNPAFSGGNLNQQLYGSGGGGTAPLSGFSASPYFTSQPQQQPGIYGQYTNSGFVAGMQQQQQQQQQHSPHNL